MRDWLDPLFEAAEMRAVDALTLNACSTWGPGSPASSTQRATAPVRFALTNPAIANASLAVRAAP